MQLLKSTMSSNFFTNGSTKYHFSITQDQNHTSTIFTLNAIDHTKISFRISLPNNWVETDTITVTIIMQKTWFLVGAKIQFIVHYDTFGECLIA